MKMNHKILYEIQQYTNDDDFNALHTRCDVIPKEKPILIVHIYG